MAPNDTRARLSPLLVKQLRFILAAGALLALSVSRLTAQSPFFTPLINIGSESDERARLEQLTGATTSGYYLRAVSTRTPRLPGDSTRFRWALLSPEITTVWNSWIPFSLNDGAMWASRGWNEEVRIGARFEWGRFFAIVAPEFIASDNGPYEMPEPNTRLPLPAGRNPLSSPWHTRPSIDAPLRFGTHALSFGDPGQSTIGARFGAITAGISTENEWWGPGIRNAIILSNNAAGIPRAFVRTTRPLQTGIGAIEGSWFIGGLFESHFFDNEWQDDRRSITGIALTWRPKFEPNLTFGIARTVYASMLGWDRLPTHLFDVLRDRGTRITPDSGAVNSREQIAALSGRWVFPAARFAAHFEWARTELPTSLRDFLVSPTHSQGYTLGLEWATPVGRSPNLLRFQAEHTYLERSPSYRDRPLASFYTSPSVAQGYTQRGQVIGAAIGQGGSGHWLRLDYFMPRWRAGLQLGRIRWDDDALYRFGNVYYVNKWCAHDVSLYAGVTASHTSRWGRISASLTRGERINMFFYHTTWCGSTADPIGIVDARNTTLDIRLSAP